MSSRNVRQKTAAAEAEQAMDEACREALAAAQDLNDFERLRRKFEQFLEEADAKVAGLGGERLERWDEMIWQGRCPECSLQAHELDLTPLPDENETSGTCLFSDPAVPTAGTAAVLGEEAGSPSSRVGTVTPLAVPEEAEAKSARFCDRGVWGDYVGDLDANGRRHGRGRITYDDGEFYDGEFENDERNGQGSYRDKKGCAYDGGWKNDEREGRGLVRLPDGTKRYEGGYVRGKAEGNGTAWCSNDSKYEGGWRGGKKEGQGVYTWANGNSYTGGWKGDKREGGGIYRYTDGRIEILVYTNGKISGNVVRWSADRRTAWLLGEGKITREIELSEAKATSSRMGFDGVP